MKKEILRLHGKFQSIMQLGRQMEKTPRKFGTDELLSHAEIHMIEIIGNNEGQSVTDIAGHLCITKGAVSQGLKRLEKKGFSFKKTDPDNLSRSIVTLTSKGYTAYYAHKHWHETMDGGFGRYLESLGESDLLVILQFLEKTEAFLKLRLESDA